ncbi:hypothetical protein K2173_010125 [Erythroxylum novogranatense]|uniref:Pectinesterase inhibitor domain-containing protein n=1 Tax=Erythroxylum novogranatense TaxID=1862640 RepID=A0AAV8TSZ0_9ROSI|nr:hypothetical protein K2173_010125 [Erythroxylum novogranatense]
MKRLPCLLITAVLLLFHYLPTAVSQAPAPAPDNHSRNNATDYIRSSCNATLYPEVCYSSLSRYSSAVQQSPGRLARVAIGVSLSRAHNMAVFVSNVSRQADYGSVPREAAALHDCFSNFGDAVDEIRASLKQMRQLDSPASSAQSFRFLMSNVQTWMSAALTDEETCTDGFEDVPDSLMKTAVCDRAANVKKFTSNALALVNSYAAKGSP